MIYRTFTSVLHHSRSSLSYPLAMHTQTFSPTHIEQGQYCSMATMRPKSKWRRKGGVVDRCMVLAGAVMQDEEEAELPRGISYSCFSLNPLSKKTH